MNFYGEMSLGGAWVYLGDIKNGGAAGYGTLMSRQSVYGEESPSQLADSGWLHNNSRRTDDDPLLLPIHSYNEELPFRLTYSGEFYQGRYHGLGARWNEDGSVYEGRFVNGQINGEGFLSVSDGTVYHAADFNLKKVKSLTFSGEMWRWGNYFQGDIIDGGFGGHGTLISASENEAYI